MSCEKSNWERGGQPDLCNLMHTSNPILQHSVRHSVPSSATQSAIVLMPSQSCASKYKLLRLSCSHETGHSGAHHVSPALPPAVASSPRWSVHHLPDTEARQQQIDHSQCSVTLAAWPTNIFDVLVCQVLQVARQHSPASRAPPMRQLDLTFALKRCGCARSGDVGHVCGALL